MSEKVLSENGAQRKIDNVIVPLASTEVLMPEEDQRLLRKIDVCLLPVMAFSYMFQFLDKSSLGYTAIMGLRSDLHLTGKEYSWSSGIYYVGYLLATYPAGLIMIRWRVGKTIAIAIVLWGAVLLLTAFVTNAASLLAVRFFLGVCEAPIAPGLTVIVAMWYKRTEQPLRQTGWFLGNTTAGIFGGFAAYGIGHVHSLAPWKAVFLIFGGFTLAWSVFVVFLLPDEPMSACFLTITERSKAVVRVKENMTGIKNNHFKWLQCREALLDVKSWILVLIQLCGSLANGGLHGFGPIIIEGMGFGMSRTLLLNGASYLVQLAALLVCATACTYIRNVRALFMASGLAISGAGLIIIRQAPADHPWTRYGGYCLIMIYSIQFPSTMALLSSNFGGFTKITVNAMSFTAYCLGNIIGPQLFFESYHRF